MTARPGSDGNRPVVANGRPSSGPPGGAAGPGGAGRGPGGPGGRGPGMGGMFAGPPPAKPKNFRASFRRLIGQLRPEARLVALVILLAIGSVTFAVIGPKLLGDATNVIFQGVLVPLGAHTLELRYEPAGVTRGLALSGAGVAGLLALAILPLPRRRH